MSIIARPPPPSLSIPPAPRIGTSGSPLDPPSNSTLSPREGLGLGGIDMPEGMKGSSEDKDRKLDTRYLAFKPPRSKYLRHASSVSSPPSLIPFVKSLNNSSPSELPAPSVTSRKFSLQAQPTSNSGGFGHSRKASEGMISYPIQVSRIDSLPTFTPDEERRPAPMPTTTINDYQTATPPLVPTNSSDDRIPKQRRPSRTTRSPPPPLDLDLSGGSNYSVFPVKANAHATSKTRRGSNATERMEKMSTSNSGSKLKGLNISHTSSQASSHFDSSDDDEDLAPSPMIGSSSGRRESYAPSNSNFPTHRRTASEESPRIVQAVTFTRAKSAEDVVPSELPIRQIIRGTGGSQPTTTRTWNTASPALIPISEVKAVAKAKAKALDSPIKKPVPLRTTPTKQHLSSSAVTEGSKSISISVKESNQSKEKEFGQVSTGREGVTVCLKSYTKPEDMEVSWSCVPKIDEEGRAFTQWQMKFQPRSSTGGPSTQTLPPLPSASSNFLNYRINAGPSASPSLSNFPPPPPPPHVGRTYSTTSPLSQTIDPLVAAASTSLPPLESSRRRKSSSTSTSRSDSFSNGTSFSSESSYGPLTPASSTSGYSHRRRKSSSISHSSYDLAEEKELPPPLPTTTFYFDIPLPPSTTTRSIPQERPSSPSRQVRSSSHNVGRTRQFSIDPSVYVPRSASIPEASLYASTPIKSPSRDNRLARCLPPSGEAQVDLAALASSSSSGPINSSSGGSFLASRKQLIAPPPSLSIPPLPTSSLEETPASSSSSGARITSPFTPSPLGRSANNQVLTYSSSSNASSLSDQMKTPTKSTHFGSSKLSTTPTLSPPSSAIPATTSYYTLNKDYYDSRREGGGTSEELVSRQSRSRSLSPSATPSPVFSNDEFDDTMTRMRHGKRMMSRWSDTETEEDDELSKRETEGLTSWGRIPDANTTTDDEDE
ncbi:uncharacterized protein JCM6883_004414 [Sporobolomyces salmoneus]|uniref:uncharacterized protein n=1 Tax=Sporobolomyces salmoneus TaxID=183962 RepID=UPI003176D663